MDSDNITFFNVIINLDDDNFDEEYPAKFVLVRRIGWCYRFKQHKACRKKRDKELISISWHPTRV